MAIQRPASPLWPFALAALSAAAGGCADQRVQRASARLAQEAATPRDGSFEDGPGAADGRGDGAATADAAAGRGDGRSDAADSGCGSITKVGCCAGGVLWFCKQGRLRAIDCGGRPRCGWRSGGIYDCDTSGASDPSSKHAKQCVFGDAGPPLDAGGSIDGGGRCGSVTVEGCCAAGRLVFCADGELTIVDCRSNPSCGWRAAGQLYNCGTSGGTDPSGRFSRRCPAGALGDAGALDASEAGADAAGDATSRDGRTTEGGVLADGSRVADGCCAIGGGAGGRILESLLLGLLALARRRPRSPSA